MKRFRAWGRLLYFLVYITIRVLELIAVNLFNRSNILRSLKIRRSFVHHIFPVLGIRLKVSGTPPDFPCIVVGNHRSYLDPAVIVNDVLGYGVSKAEVEHWPLIGYGIKLSGVLFLKRESPNSRKKTLQGIAQRVKEGWPVMLFPEGTTHAEPKTIDFRPGVFRLAAAENIPIVPIAIEYGEVEDSWVGSDGFLSHFLRRFSERRMLIHARYGPVFQGNDSEMLLNQCKSWIDQALAGLQIALENEKINFGR